MSERDQQPEKTGDESSTGRYIPRGTDEHSPSTNDEARTRSAERAPPNPTAAEQQEDSDATGESRSSE